MSIFRHDLSPRSFAMILCHLYSSSVRTLLVAVVFRLVQLVFLALWFGVLLLGGAALRSLLSSLHLTVEPDGEGAERLEIV